MSDDVSSYSAASGADSGPPADQKASYEAVRFNALKHGILSRHTVLPHEDAAEFSALLGSLVEEHQPQGATEAHLVEELAGIMWRKRRVLLGEGANINRGLRYSVRDDDAIAAAVPLETDLSRHAGDLLGLLSMSPEEVAERQQEAAVNLEVTRDAATVLKSGVEDAYEVAMTALLPDSCESWQECVDEGEYPANAEGLADFIRRQLEPLCRAMYKEACLHEAIKAQAMGEALQPYYLEKLNRYEAHLDRKFQRTLGMLVQLKGLRQQN